MNKPLVSAITPTKNRAWLTQQCVRQFLKQTYEPRELIIVEDGDSDLRPWLMTMGGLKAGLRNFATNLNKFGGLMTFKISDGVTIKYLRAEATTGMKLNLAAEVAEGEYLFRFDSDDWFHPSRIEVQMEHFESSGANLIGLSSMVFYEEGRPHGWIWTGIGCDPMGASQAFRRDWFLANPAPDRSLSEDSAMARIAWETECLFCVAGLNGLIVARDHPDNTGIRSLEEERASPFCENFLKLSLGNWYTETVRPWVREPLEATPIDRIPKIDFPGLDAKMAAHNKAARERGLVRTGDDAPQETIEIGYSMRDGRHRFSVSHIDGESWLSLGDVERLIDIYERNGFAASRPDRTPGVTDVLAGRIY